MPSNLFNRLAIASLAAAALLAFGTGARAAAPVAADFTAAPCCQLCPEARDPNNYVTAAQQNFKALMKGEGDWLFRSGEDLRTEFDTTAEGYRRLGQVRDAFKARGIDLVVVYQPTRGMVDRRYMNPADLARFDYPRALKNYQAMLGRFARIGFYTPDLSGLTDEGQAHDFYFRGDQHWTPYGAERTSRIVAQTIKQVPAYKDIPKREFETHWSGRMGKSGTLHGMAGQICNTSYAIQYMDQFSTQPKAEATSGELFGDSPLPQITLVGTSHSSKNYNFAGFLQEYVGADILDVAFPGGGLEGSMIEYLGSDEFRKHPPKIIVWEFSPLYSLDQETIYRQILALLDDGCHTSGIEQTQIASLKPNTRTDLLVNGRDGIRDWRNATHLIDIKFADPTVKTLQATLWYLNGRHEDLKLEKPTTVDTNGRFIFQLRDDGDWAGQTLLSLELQGPQTDAPEDLTPMVKAARDPLKTVVHVNNIVPTAPVTAPVLAPLRVEVKICKRQKMSTLSQRTAQAGP